MRNYQEKANKNGLADSITAERYGAGEYNSISKELKNLGLSAGLTLADASGTGETFDQLSQATAIYGAGGASHHVDSGVVNAYILSTVGSKESPASYFDGFTVSFVPGTPNTGASTVNIGGIGVKSITDKNGNATVEGDISGPVAIRYNSSADRFEIVSSLAKLRTVNAVADLRTITGVSGDSALARGYYAPGDGGGGPLRVWKTGTIGTYVDNGGSIIVPTGGDGSGAWVWEWSGLTAVEWFGASETVTALQNHTAIQSALDTREPCSVDGNYIIDAPLVLYHGSELRGFNTRFDKRIAGGDQPKQSSITQSTPGTHAITLDQTDLFSSYVWGVKISDIVIIGNQSLGSYGVYLQNSAHATLSNVSIYDFDFGLRINYSMYGTYRDVVIQGTSALNACVFIDSAFSITTTQTFHNCIFRQAKWGYINTSAAGKYTINTVFNDCDIESTYLGGAYIESGNSATFNNLTAENVPDDRTAVGGTTTGAIFELGTGGTKTSTSNAWLAVNSGTIAGGNAFLYTDSAIFRVGEWWRIDAVSSEFMRATKLLDLETGSTLRVGGLSIHAIKTVSLSNPTSIDDQVYSTDKIAGSFVSNSTGVLRNKVVELERVGVNTAITDHRKLAGTGTIIRIPITSQNSLNVKHRVKIQGFDGTNNVANPKPFYTDFAVGSLTTLISLTSWNTSTNITSVTVNGMNIDILLNYTIVTPHVTVEIVSENASLFSLDAITVQP